VRSGLSDVSRGLSSSRAIRRRLNDQQRRGCSLSGDACRLPRLPNRGSGHHAGESPALSLTRYFCNRGLEQPTAAVRQLLAVRCGSGRLARAEQAPGSSEESGCGLAGITR
jgi:hypothetical protein